MDEYQIMRARIGTAPSPLCLHCDEPVNEPADWIPVVTADSTTLRARHPVCAIRAVIGGINHLQKRCICCGGTEPPDPPGMSRYQAAVAAVAYYRSQAESPVL